MFRRDLADALIRLAYRIDSRRPQLHALNTLDGWQVIIHLPEGSDEVALAEVTATQSSGRVGLNG